MDSEADFARLAENLALKSDAKVYMIIDINALYCLLFRVIFHLIVQQLYPTPIQQLRHRCKIDACNDRGLLNRAAVRAALRRQRHRRSRPVSR
jgi:hypothetical protein